MSSVADIWRVLTLLTSIEPKYQKTTVKGSFVLLYGFYMEVQAGAFWVTPLTMAVNTDGPPYIKRDVNATIHRFLVTT